MVIIKIYLKIMKYKKTIKLLAIFLVFFVFSCESIQNLTKHTENLSDGKLKKETPSLNGQGKNYQTIKVALLLPITGKNKDLGQALYNTAVMSLFDNDKTGKIELFLFDSKEGPKDCVLAANDIIKKDIKIIVGPVFSDCLEAIAPIAKKNNLTVISLSNNQKFSNYTGIFLAGLFVEDQIDRSVSYSILRGKKNFAAILPNNQYGLAFSRLLKENVKIKGGNYILEEFYQPNDKNLANLVNKIINSSATISSINGISDKIYPQVIFIPEAGKNSAKIVSLIKDARNTQRFEIVGSSNWDDIATLNNPSLAGSWFSGPEYQKFDQFEKNYYQIYSKFPPRISSIIYDIVAVISEITNRNQSKIPEFKDFIFYDQNLTRNGFRGIDGLFRFLENGLLQRNLAIIEVGNGTFYTLDKPLDQFVHYNVIAN
jgi:branched-chain amino acid transport system substrate-binding protein